jgi:hypothetical protein
MKQIIVRSPRGAVAIASGWGAPDITTKDLIRHVAELFQYKTILNGSEAGQLLDCSDTQVHPTSVVTAGEYNLVVMHDQWP